ncbi:thiamine phosphate synthase [Caballeronia sp. dw_276]|jgi:thiamine-phosphate pyrophosphorylase|uniref:thiamine phosphate synthase n=1 Tax=Caballeronia sp. dw_276 TaxID=2719795 RepID=UPI001BD6D3C0|nr:thiamine phosphate synthase [Caballeronia sp. dw_276]
MSLLTQDREIFWPPADELLEAAERIRRRLGEWPAASKQWRICLSAPDRPLKGDLIVGSGLKEPPPNGVGLLDAGAGHATLQLDGVEYALEGDWSDDWLAAMAAFLDCGFEPHDALVLALAWRPTNLDELDAWPVDFYTFPKVANLPAPPLKPFAHCPDRLGLYAVLPSAEWVEQVLDQGVKTVQLRRKSSDSGDLKQEIERSVAAGVKHQAQLFINDHWQAAIAAGAYGVHLGQEDVDTADLNAIAEAGLRLGLSTHGYYEMLKALHFKPSYLALGAVFPTTTKVMPTAPQGISRLARYVRLLDGIVPLVAIGGVNGSVLQQVLSTGVGSAAVVRAITEAPELATAISALQQEFAR